MTVQICVGSSCYLKGSERMIELFQNAILVYGLQSKVSLGGSFCNAKCNRIGTTISVDGEIYTGITADNFREFFQDKILEPIEKGRDR